MLVSEAVETVSALVYYGEAGHVSDWKKWRRELLQVRAVLAAEADASAVAFLWEDHVALDIDGRDFYSDHLGTLREWIERADGVLAARQHRCGLPRAVAVPSWAA